MEEKLNDIIKQLDALSSYDRESAHGDADDLLCDALTLLGRDDIAQAFKKAHNRVGFWYA